MRFSLSSRVSSSFSLREEGREGGRLRKRSEGRREKGDRRGRRKGRREGKWRNRLTGNSDSFSEKKTAELSLIRSQSHFLEHKYLTHYSKQSFDLVLCKYHRTFNKIPLLDVVNKHMLLSPTNSKGTWYQELRRAWYTLPDTTIHR